MTKRMLIDTTHAEETRVVVLDGNRLDDYDVETSSKKQLKGNIYLAKIVRIEPSLQAAFVEYGGNRHGFLAFSEIHPDYYQIPVADRERLIALQEEEARAEEARADHEDDGDDEAPEPTHGHGQNQGRGRQNHARHGAGSTPDQAEDSDAGEYRAENDGSENHQASDRDADNGNDQPDEPTDTLDSDAEDSRAEDSGAEGSEDGTRNEAGPVIEMPLEIEAETVVADAEPSPETGTETAADDETESEGPAEPAPETVGGENPDDGQAQRRTARFLRQYKIQEVMRRRQILLIQVVKEERGNKGAALTTYISLAGRFCVLMPNSLRGGGVSRKITSAADRRRLKEITNELEIPRGMGMIVRTAGAQRPRPEIKRDCEYLLRTWDDIRETTLASIAPCLVYEEASLIKRAIRDVYTRDVEEIVVDGEAGWKGAREFMRTLMPANAGKVNLWRDSSQTLFSHYQVEHHLDAMLQPTVQLKSGGYLVINQTEALVAIDVNSGRSTRERGIEETAFRTNMEAADEVARQLRLRDLAGLIVIDFIDMEVRRNNAAVERRLKDALRNDRARIQVGSISHFGLMEMSRQRLRPSIAESSFVTCPHCAGSGFMRGTESSALHVLRAIEEEAGKRKAAEILVHVAGSVALYVLNNKRTWLQEIETRHQLTVQLAADDSLLPPNLRIERVRPYIAPVAAQPVPASVTQIPIETRTPAIFETDAIEPEAADATGDVADDVTGDATGARVTTNDATGQAESDEAGRRRKRRRRRRGGRREDGVQGEAGTQVSGENEEGGADEEPDSDETDGDAAETGSAPIVASDAVAPPAAAEGEGSAPRGRRRRGGRNRNRGENGGQPDADHETTDPLGDDAMHRPPQRAYVGPTPADPFAGSFDIFEMIEREAEEPVAVMPNPAASAASLQPVAPPVAESVAESVAETAAEPVVVTPEQTLVDAVADAAPETAPPVAADVVVADETPATSPKPRKPRASRARKPAAPAAEAVVDPVTVESEVAPAAVAPARPARKPSTRSRAKAPRAADSVETTIPETVPTAEPAPEPAPVPEAVSSAAPEPDAAAAAASTIDPSIVQPKVIGESATPAARRTGWWKR